MTDVIMASECQLAGYASSVSLLLLVSWPSRRLMAMLARFPLTSLRVVTLIYWNALKLKLKGAPYFRHPKVTS